MNYIDGSRAGVFFSCSRLSLVMLGVALLPTFAFADDDRNLDFMKIEKYQSNFEKAQEMWGIMIDYNNAAQCGGWNNDRSVSGPPPDDFTYGQQDSQMISWVDGAPGRRGIPLANRESGMAWRVEDGDPNGDGMSMTMTSEGPKGNGYTYPQTARGLSTSCVEGQEEKEVNVWGSNDGCEYGDPTDLEGDGPGGTPSRNCTRTVAYPKFGKPACLWWNNEEQEVPLSEENCLQFGTWTNDANQYSFPDCREVEERERVIDEETGETETYYVCVRGGRRWVCSDDWVEDASAMPTLENKNTKICEGACCRCPGPACNVEMCQPAANMSPWRSYYRTYSVTTNREKLDEVPSDALANTSAQVHCYDLYSEFDPMRVNEQPKPCVIGEFMTENGKFKKDEVKQSQMGRGNVNSPLSDSLPEARPYDETKDPWYTRLSGAFSFLQPNQDLSAGMLYPDLAQVQATPQTANGLWAKYSIQRSVDDTVSDDRGRARMITQWWQQFEKGGHEIFTPSVVRLRLPANWQHSVSDLHPLNVYQGALDAPIDVQINARDDLLGLVVGYLTSTLLLDIREEPIPMIVPMGSPIEFRAAAERWRSWKEQRSAAGLSVPGQVSGLITKLEDYAKQIERTRAVRNELAVLLSKLIERQSNFLLNINAWAQYNESMYQQYIEYGKKRNDLHQQYEEVERTMAKFNDDTNMPWCRNDRFTTPIYSLLDSWYPTREALYPYPMNLSGGLPVCSPTGAAQAGGYGLSPLCLPRDAEYLMDLSTLKISTGSLVLPVIRPIQVRLDIPLPGDATMDEPNPDRLNLPNFPEIPTISDDFAENFPEAETISFPASLQEPWTEDLEPLRTALIVAQLRIMGMDQTYKSFWESLEFPSPPPECKGQTMGELDCCSVDDNRCQHAEMDLIERFTRITARPGVQLKEDLETTGIGREPMPANYYKPFRDGPVDSLKDVTCWAEDHVCQKLLGEFRYPRDGWQVLQPPSENQQEALDAARKEARGATFDEELNLIGPSFVAPPEQLIPEYNIPIDMPITPKR